LSDEIDTLSAADWDSLRRYAHYRMSRAPRMIGKGPEDLLGEALLAYSRGGRRRVAGQPLIEHLFGIMHSIAGGWARWRKNTAEEASGLLNEDPESEL